MTAVDRTEEWERLRAEFLQPAEKRPASSASGVHHAVYISSDVARTIRFYQGMLEMPVTEIFENRDYPGSTHFFFDIGNGNALAFFDFPDLGLESYEERLGGSHHLAISVAPDRWEHLKAKLEAAGQEIHVVGGSSLYLEGPDGERIELINDPLGTMDGKAVI